MRISGLAALLLGIITGCWAAATMGHAEEASRPPNFVILFADDLGYADLHCFGGEQMVTPNLDNMAREGMRLTSFYVSQAVCSASRCSLLTGCYNVRLSILGALGPGAKICLHPDEQTIAEVLKPLGYHTAIFGKWHLGDRGIGLPIHHGFDEYHGLPYSNDMWPYHPTNKSFPPLPLIENDRVINDNVTAEDQKYLTRWATEHAVSFIERHRDEPFFLYVPYSMPHVPIFASPQFAGATGRGLYADVIAEIDWSVGEILNTLRRFDLAENTLVLFTSDNGPWLSYGNHAGSAKPLREGKGTAWEGGQREPTIVWWPGKVPAGTTCDAVAGTIDVLPTIAHLAGAPLPQRPIDGKNIWSLLSGESSESPHEAYFYYWGRELHAVRSGPWKLHFPHSYRSLKGEPGRDGKPGPYQQLRCGLELYNLDQDIGEQQNVADQHPEIVARLSELADGMRRRLGDKLTGIEGTEVREAGRLP
ncbi:MAG: arylsulfatase [Pirellulaceae bacterium]|nr:MAG: arylsulfatase [Pirellulaceae bacterium]